MHTENYKDVCHQVIADREGPYYMGEALGFKARLKNLLNEPCEREFWYRIQLPDGMYLEKPLYPVQFEPREEKVIQLGNPIFLGFLGMMRVVLVTGEAERLLIKGGMPLPERISFLTLFAGYSRDREGYELQKQMVKLTRKIGWLTRVLVGITVVLVVLTAVLIWLNVCGY